MMHDLDRRVNGVRCRKQDGIFHTKPTDHTFAPVTGLTNGQQQQQQQQQRQTEPEGRVGTTGGRGGRGSEGKDKAGIRSRDGKEI